jgi:hypothetical protein
MREHEVTIPDCTLPVNAAIQRARRRSDAVLAEGIHGSWPLGAVVEP